MSTVSAQPAPIQPKQPAAMPLGRHTARGFVWMLLQTLVTKGAGMVGQVAMAWYLSPHDFKLVGLTYAVASFPNLIRDAGLQTILVQRQRQLRRWIGPVFWLSLVLGLAAGLMMAAAAPLAARLYGQPQLAGLICVVAVGAVVGAVGTVPNAIVQIQLRFRLQAMLALAAALLTVVLNVLFAYGGWGPYSFIIPLALINGLRSAALWAAAPNRIPLRLHLKRWRYVISDSGILLLAGVVGIAIAQGDYLIIGLFHRGATDEAVGIFFFAFNLSMQTLVLLTTNLGGVLFPTLVKLHNDPPRQIQAYLRAARVLALVGVPACFLQAALTNPGFHLVFKPKWYPAIHVTEVLSLVMAIRTVGLTWLTFTAAQGRFKMQLILLSSFCALFLSSVAVGARFGGALTVAVTEAVFFTIVDPLAMYILLKANGVNAMRELARIFLAPLGAGAIAVGGAYLAGRALPHFRGSDAVEIALITLLAGSAYVVLIRRIAPADWTDLLSLRRSGKVA